MPAGGLFPLRDRPAALVVVTVLPPSVRKWHEFQPASVQCRMRFGKRPDYRI